MKSIAYVLEQSALLAALMYIKSPMAVTQNADAMHLEYTHPPDRREEDERYYAVRNIHRFMFVFVETEPLICHRRQGPGEVSSKHV